ncbi:unnamed protein product [Brassica napus]|uniref:(rape) hypothetical protein n=1 Tax=Brassica napus TaxID=3708 RepID=A0A816JH02_BRANA|nr:unnamed protein product [Brassica napus]
MHQDAHEFLNYLLNELDDILEKEAKTDNETSSSPGKISNGPKLLQANGVHKEPTVTWVHKIFQFSVGSYSPSTQGKSFSAWESWCHCCCLHGIGFGILNCRRC